MISCCDDGHRLKGLIVTGEPIPEVKWSKDGERVQQGDRVQLVDNAAASTSELNIFQARVEDSGVYSAEASNMHGTVQTTAVVKVAESVQEMSKQQRETVLSEKTAKTVEELRQEEVQEISVKEEKVVVIEKKEKAQEVQEDIRESGKEVTTEIVEKESQKPEQTPKVEESVVEAEKPAAVKKELVLKGARVEKEQFEKVVQEVSEEVKVEEKVTKTVTEPETLAPVKKQLVLEGVKVEEKQFEKVVQEVSEEVKVEEKVETKRLASGFGAATVTELTSDSVTLNWEEPKDTGGVKIIHYLIVMRESDKAKYKRIAEVDGNTHSYTVTKIKEDHEYYFRVYAQNEVGISTEFAEVATSIKIPKGKKDKKERAPEPTPEAVEETVETQTVTETHEKTEETAETAEEEGKQIIQEEIREEKHEIIQEEIIEVSTVKKELEAVAPIVEEKESVAEEESKEGPVKEVAESVRPAELEKPAAVGETIKAEVVLPQENTKDEAEAELTLKQEPKEQPKVDEATAMQKMDVRIQSEAESSKEHVEITKQEDVAVVREEITNSQEKVQSPVSEVKSQSLEIKAEASDSLVAEVADKVELKSAADTVVVSKETVTRKKKKSKGKRENTASTIVEETRIVQEIDEKISEEITVDDRSQKEAEEEKIDMDDKTVTLDIADAEDAATKNVAEKTATAEVEEIDVEYSEEEFEGPLPLIEVKPVPTTVNVDETVRLVCKVAEEPPAEISWSKNGRKLDVNSDSKKVITGVDVNTGMHFMEIAEASLEDIGEYTLTAENEGGTVACTVSVDVVSKTAKETLQSVTVSQNVEQTFRSLEQVAVDTEAYEDTKPLGKVETGEMVAVEAAELPKASESGPVFVSTLQPVCVDEGSAVRLECRVEGQTRVKDSSEWLGCGVELVVA